MSAHTARTVLLLLAAAAVAAAAPLPANDALQPNAAALVEERAGVRVHVVDLSLSGLLEHVISKPLDRWELQSEMQLLKHLVATPDTFNAAAGLVNNDAPHHVANDGVHRDHLLARANAWLKAHGRQVTRGDTQNMRVAIGKDVRTNELIQWLRKMNLNFRTGLSAYPAVLVQGGGPTGLAAALYARHGKLGAADNARHGAATVHVREARNEYNRQHIISLHDDNFRGNDAALVNNDGAARKYRNFDDNDATRKRYGFEKLLGLIGAGRDTSPDLRSVFPWSPSAVNRYIKISVLEKLLCMAAHAAGVTLTFNLDPRGNDVAATVRTPTQLVERVYNGGAGNGVAATFNAFESPDLADCPNGADNTGGGGAEIPALTLQQYHVVVIAEGTRSKTRVKYLKRKLAFTTDHADDQPDMCDEAVFDDDPNVFVTPRAIVEANEAKFPANDNDLTTALQSIYELGDNPNGEQRFGPTVPAATPPGAVGGTELLHSLHRPSEKLRGDGSFVTAGFVIPRGDGFAGLPCSGIPALTHGEAINFFNKVKDQSWKNLKATTHAKSLAAQVLHYKAFDPQVGGNKGKECQLEIMFRQKSGALFNRAMQCGYNLNKLKTRRLDDVDDKQTKPLNLMRRVLERTFMAHDEVNGVADANQKLVPPRRTASAALFRSVAEFKLWDNRGRMSVATSDKDAAHPMPQVGQINYRKPAANAAHRHMQLFVALGDSAREALPDLGMGANDGHDNARRLGELVDTLHADAEPLAAVDCTPKRQAMCRYLKRHALHVRDTVRQIHLGIHKSKRLYQIGYDNIVSFSLRNYGGTNRLKYKPDGFAEP